MNEPNPKSRSGPPTLRQDRKGLSPLAAASLALAIVVGAVFAWLAMSGPPERPEPAAPTVVKIPPPPEPEQIAEVPAGDHSLEAASDAAETATPPPQRPAEPTPEPASPDPAPPAPGHTSEIGDRPPEEAIEASPATPGAGTGPTLSPAPPESESTVEFPDASGDGLTSAPPPDPVEKTRLGPLPRTSPDGRKPSRTYARPFEGADRRPRIAIIVVNLGLSSAATETAIERLPGAVTLSFAPYVEDLGQWIARARKAGHEVMLDLPMEPVTVPPERLGPHTLLTTLPAEENMERLHWLLGRAAGYVGAINQMGSRFTASEPHVRPILQELKERGLLFVDSRSSLHSVASELAERMGLPHAINNRFIDAEASGEAVDGRLRELEEIAHSSGHAVGVGGPSTVTIDRLVDWASRLDGKGLLLAPVSALVDGQGN